MAKVKQKVVVPEAMIDYGMEVPQKFEEGVEQQRQLSVDEMQGLVDDMFGLDQEQKRMAKTVEEGKVKLLDYARMNQLHVLLGKVAMARISDAESTTLPASKLVKYLEKEGKMKLLDSLVKVQVGEFKKYLGADLLKKMGNTEVVAFKSISLKEQKE